MQTNNTIKGIEIDINLKPNTQIIQQKARPIPIHLQQSVGNELKRIIKLGHIEKAKDLKNDSFISPVFMTVKKDRSIKIAIDSRKLNDACIKRQAQMPNMEELINKISKIISENTELELWISKVDLDYAYGQMKLSKNAQKHCVFAMVGGDFTGYYRFLKGFYGLADMPPIFQQKIDETLEHKTPAWLDDIIIVTRGNINKHQKDVERVLTQLQNAGYRASTKKNKILPKRNRMARISNKRTRNKTNTRKDGSINKSNRTQKSERIKIISRCGTTSIKIHQKFI